MNTLMKFKDPQPSEENDRFFVVENRGERVLVADANHIWDSGIRPTFVYLVDDLILA